MVSFHVKIKGEEESMWNPVLVLLSCIIDSVTKSFVRKLGILGSNLDFTNYYVNLSKLFYFSKYFFVCKVGLITWLLGKIMR